MKHNYRYAVLTLLFLATVINYIDRQIIGLLKPTLESEFHWTEQDYANIVFWFQMMYALGYFLSGRFVDKVGAKIGFAIAVFSWSIAAMAHASVRTVSGFNIARGALGFFEGGNFPAAVKSIAEWFPVKERSLASGIMISGTTIGPILAPGIVLWLAESYNWQVSFIVTGSLGLIWVIAWLLFYEKPERNKYINRAELEYIKEVEQDDGENNKTSLSILLKEKATWGFFMATFLTDPVWWFYLFWLPSFLTANGMQQGELILPMTLVYSVTAILSVAGGWLSSYFIKIGMTVNQSRKRTMLICVALALPVILIRFSGNVWLSVMIIAVAAAAQTIWKGVLLTTVADQFPKNVVSSVTGIGGLGGALGGMLTAYLVGLGLSAFKAENNLQAGYNLIFIGCGLSYIIAITIFHILSPQLKKIRLEPL
ncbi:MAG TPA: MFS transporter [Chryseolinea sp.]|nr:MFS transporter [Chryseolinea sp.]